MSDNILKLIPVSPDYVPDVTMIRRVSDLLSEYFPEASGIDYSLTEEVRFIDQGGNWERVLCPVCGTELDAIWWDQAMDAAYLAGFTNLSVRLPCCNTLSSLNGLKYEWPAGFARFALEIRNPGGDLGNGKLKSLEQILKCELRKIWAHY